MRLLQRRARVRRLLLGMLMLPRSRLVAAPATADQPAAPVRHEGRLPSGANYLIEIPAGWNGTLLLWSKGWGPGGPEVPAANAPGDAARRWLLDRGYALAGSSYSGSGWAIEEAFGDQVATVDPSSRRCAGVSAALEGRGTAVRLGAPRPSTVARPRPFPATGWGGRRGWRSRPLGRRGARA